MPLTARPRRAAALLPLLLLALAHAAPANGSVPAREPVIIGVNDGSGWGAADAERLHELGFTSERIVAGEGPTLSDSLADGWSNDVLTVGNIPDEESLAEVAIPAWTAQALAQVREAAARGVTLFEVGNEMYLKGPACGGCGRHPEPARYAQMFISLARAVAGAHIEGAELLFDGYGDYQESEGGPWSQVWSGGGWIASAVDAEPELRTRVDGFTMHPYGAPGENKENDGGPVAMEVQHEQAVSLGFQSTGFYATEIGVPVEGQPDPSSLARQAQEIEELYDELISYGFVRGIWYYQTHDDSTGRWGLIEQQTGESPFVGRPSLRVLSALALTVQSASRAAEPDLTSYGSGPTAGVTLAGTEIDYRLHLELAQAPWSDGPYD